MGAITTLLGSRFHEHSYGSWKKDVPKSLTLDGSYTLPLNYYSNHIQWCILTALTPQTTVVFPSFTKADPSAVDIEPGKNSVISNGKLKKVNH